MNNHNPDHKQLELNSLIEFSQLISSKLDLKYILNNILLSIMGKMLISKGVILLANNVEKSNLFNVEAAKGIDPKIINSVLEIDFPKLSVFNAGDIKADNNFIADSGLNYFLKIYFQNKFLGLLCLGKKLNNSEMSKNEIIFIETMLNISASAIENSIKFNEVSSLNSDLNNKIRQLKSLFELGKEFNSNFTNKENIIKLLGYTLLGNYGIREFVIIARGRNGKFYLMKDNTNLDLSEFDLEKLFPQGQVPDNFKKSQKITSESDNKFIKYLYQNGFQVLVPTVIKNEVFSVILLGKKLNNSSYNDADIEFLESLINLSLISVQNSDLFNEYLEKQKIENELKIAREIQLALLPQKIPEIKNYELAGMNLPALQVGGDYYDFIKLTESKTAIVIADVSGKGTPASLLMANIQSAVHSYLKLYDENSFDLAKATEKINELIYENTSPEKFITFFWGILDSEKNIFEYINAGHNPPLMLNGSSIMTLDKGGFIIGILNSGLSYEIGRIKIEMGDVIVFYTDGVTEANNLNGEEFGEDNLMKVLLKTKDYSSQIILDNIGDSILQFTKDTAQYDDITLIVLKSVN